MASAKPKLTKKLKTEACKKLKTEADKTEKTKAYYKRMKNGEC